MLLPPTVCSFYTQVHLNFSFNVGKVKSFIRIIVSGFFFHSLLGNVDLFYLFLNIILVGHRSLIQILICVATSISYIWPLISF